jgi:3alpha(or 20beta)-hydroxysteroid dehydrogenase
MGRLEDRVAIITGAARGTGEVAARRLVAEGARVLLGDILDEQGESVAEELGAAARYVRLDVRREADWEHAVKTAVSEFGALHVLINNAAILHVAALSDHTLDDFRRVVEVNQIGPFLGTRAVVEPMKATGGGSIINVSSVDGLEGMNGVAAYASSKWGLRGLSKVAALELGRFGIRVNTVCPGAGSLEMILPFLPKDRGPSEAAAAHPRPVLSYRKPLKREEKLEEIAELIVFLAADQSRSCTGGDYPIDSGYTAGKIIPGAPGS